MGRFTLTERIEDALVLETKFGKLVCWKVRDDEDYREFSIDLIASDGKEFQVATIGTCENSDDPHFNDDMIHIYGWNGQNQDCSDQLYMDPHGDGYYYDPKEDE